MRSKFERSNLAWPNPNTELFGLEGELIAMTPSYGKQWGRFADAYLMAAEALVRELEREEADLDEPQTRLDYLVFPTVYLFRHYVELRLKEIIEGGLSLLNDPTAWQMNHDLKYLWALTRKILSQVYPNDSVSDLDCVERLILQIHSVDVRRQL